MILSSFALWFIQKDNFGLRSTALYLRCLRPLLRCRQPVDKEWELLNHVGNYLDLFDCGNVEHRPNTKPSTKLQWSTEWWKALLMSSEAALSHQWYTSWSCQDQPCNCCCPYIETRAEHEVRHDTQSKGQSSGALMSILKNENHQARREKSKMAAVTKDVK